MNLKQYLRKSNRQILIEDYVYKNLTNEFESMIKQVESDNFSLEEFNDNYKIIVEEIVNELLNESVDINKEYGQLKVIDGENTHSLFAFHKSKNGQQITNGVEPMYEVPTEQFIIERINAQVYSAVKSIN